MRVALPRRGVPLVLALFVTAVTSCTLPQPLVQPRPLSVQGRPEEYVAFLQGGAGEIAGQAFLTTVGGDVKLAAGRLVTLDPATPVAREWFRRFGASVDGFAAPPPDSLVIRARRTTTANAEGRFRFTNLAPGSYIVRTVVSWMVPGTINPMQGGVVAKLVEVQGTAPIEVVVNDVYTPDKTAMLGVELISDELLAARSFTVVGKAVGGSCQVGLFDPKPTESAAKADALKKAAQLGADGVGRFTCTKYGVSFRPNCTARIMCEGDAIRWTSP